MTTFASIIKALCNFQEPNEIDIFNELKEEAISTISGWISEPGQSEYIVHAPPQMGKTGYMLEACKRVKDQGILIVISVDNKKDQLEQTFNRFKGHGIQVFCVSDMNKNFIKEKLSKNKSVVVFCMNNASQIKKLKSIMTDKTVVLHDEGDLVYQSDSDTAGKTQEAWEDVVVSSKRIWISATPENCSFIRKISVRNILSLPTDPRYTSVNDWEEWKNDFHVVQETVENLNPEDREITLICTDPKVSCHDAIANNLSLLLPRATVVVYNGTESYSIYNQIKQTFTSGILQFLNFQEEYEPTNVVIIGHALLSRGISFCSEGKAGKSFMATRMFYMGENAHAVALSQRFGRITGTCRPDLEERKLYCSKEVYSNYTSYLDNQVKVINSKCAEDMLEALKKISNKRQLSCKLDRATMRLMNKQYIKDTQENQEPEPETETETDNTYIAEKALRLVKSWKKPSNKSAVARLYRKMVENGGRLENDEVKTYFKSEGAYYSLSNDNRKSTWNLVFSKNEDYHYIKQELLDL